MLVHSVSDKPKGIHLALNAAPLVPTKARDAKVRILEITRTVSTFLPQRWAKSTSFSAGLALMSILVGDEVCEPINLRRRILDI